MWWAAAEGTQERVGAQSHEGEGGGAYGLEHWRVGRTADNERAILPPKTHMWPRAVSSHAAARVRSEASSAQPCGRGTRVPSVAAARRSSRARGTQSLKLHGHCMFHPSVQSDGWGASAPSVHTTTELWAAWLRARGWIRT